MFEERSSLVPFANPLSTFCPVCKFRSLEAKEMHDHKMIIWSKDGCSNKPSNTHYLVVWVADMAKIFYYGILLV